jgi:hypothetical protein
MGWAHWCFPKRKRLWGGAAASKLQQASLPVRVGRVGPCLVDCPSTNQPTDHPDGNICTQTLSPPAPAPATLGAVSFRRAITLLIGGLFYTVCINKHVRDCAGNLMMFTGDYIYIYTYIGIYYIGREDSSLSRLEHY